MAGGRAGKTGGTDRLSLAGLTIFSSPVLLFQALEMPWRVFMPAFFSQTLGLPLATVGALLLWIRMFDTCADPVVGWASDHWRTPFGLRRPWMAAGLPFILLGAWGVFFAAPGISIAALAGWCLVLHLGYSLTITPHGGWGLEIARDYHERTRVMGAKIWFAMAGTPLILALPAVGERWFGAGLAEQVHMLGIALMLLAGISIPAVLALIPEPALPDGTGAEGMVAGLWRALSDRALLLVLALYALVGLADAATNATFLFLIERALGLRGWGSMLLLVPVLVSLAAIPLWARVSRRIGKRRAMIGVFAWKAATLPLSLLLPEGALLPALLFLLLSSMATGAEYMLLRAMVADVSARDRERSGARRAGSFYAVSGISLKLASALGVGAALWLLSAAGFRVDGSARDAGLVAVRLVYAVPGSVAGVLGAVLLWRLGRFYDAAAGVAPVETRAVPAADPVMGYSRYSARNRAMSASERPSSSR